MSETREPILEPDLPIVDPHHHLWVWPAAMLATTPEGRHGFEKIIRSAPRYLLDELLADVTSGHRVRATVFLEWARCTAPRGRKPCAVSARPSS